MRFSIRDLLWATLVVAMGLGWSLFAATYAARLQAGDVTGRFAVSATDRAQVKLRAPHVDVGPKGELPGVFVYRIDGPSREDKGSEPPKPMVVGVRLHSFLEKRVVMTVGQDLVFQNVGGTNEYLSASPQYNRAIGKELFPNERYKATFKEEEPYPLNLRNEYDPADRQVMVLVRKDTFMAVTDNSGGWTIKGRDRNAQFVYDRRKRRRVRDLFWATTLVAMGLGWWATNVKRLEAVGQAQRQRTTLERAREVHSFFWDYVGETRTPQPNWGLYVDWSVLDEPLVEP